MNFLTRFFFTREEEVSTLKTVGLTLLYFFVLIGLKIALLWLSPEQSEKAANSDAIDEILTKQGILGVALLVAVVGPIVEEVLFRGVIYNFFFKVVDHALEIFTEIHYQTAETVAFIVAAIVSSVLFGLVHEETTWTLFLMHTMSGLFLAHVYFKTRNLLAPIGVHMLNNAVPVLIMYMTLPG